MSFTQRRARRVAVLVAALLGVAVVETVIPAAAQDGPPLEQLLTKEEQTKLGTASMSPEKRDAMRGALIRMFRQGQGQRAPQGSDRPSGAVVGAGVVETQVDGEFNGWEGGTIIKLMNGQIWQQTEYYYEYRYAYMPKVLVYPSGGGHKMRIDGTSKPIGVQRLH
jgi:hypothetical protein